MPSLKATTSKSGRRRACLPAAGRGSPGCQWASPTARTGSGWVIRVVTAGAVVHARQLALEHRRIRLQQTLDAAGSFRTGDGADTGALADHRVVGDAAFDQQQVAAVLVEGEGVLHGFVGAAGRPGFSSLRSSPRLRPSCSWGRCRCRRPRSAGHGRARASVHRSRARWSGESARLSRLWKRIRLPPSLSVCRLPLYWRAACSRQSR